MSVPGQTSISEVPADEPTSGPCAWCGVTTSRRIEVGKPSWGKAQSNGVRVLKKRAIVVFACEQHPKTYIREIDER